MQFPYSIGLALLASALVKAGKTGRTFSVLHFYGDGPLIEARMDPIVTPGKVAGHVHTVQGGNAFNVEMGDGFNAGATCTSSLIKNDKSNYWAPKMYFKSPKNGTFYDVPLFYMNVYYFFEATDDEIVAFPPGFRMLSGNAMLRTPPKTASNQLDSSKGEIQPVQFTCPRSAGSIAKNPTYPKGSTGLNGIGMQDPNNSGAGAGFPNVNCDGYASPLRADIHFPSCYNPAAGLDNYANNTQFPSSEGASSGGNMNCPKGWIHTPHLFYELYWNTPMFASEWTDGGNSQPFVLAQGDPTGYGLHADFIAGWDVPTLQHIIDTCDTGDSGMDQCAGVPGGTNLNSKSSCNMKAPFQEVITGAMSALPGCNPLQSSGTATQVSTCGASPSIVGGAPVETGANVPTSQAAPTSTSASAAASSSSAAHSAPAYSAPSPTTTSSAATIAAPSKPTTMATVSASSRHATESHSHGPPAYSSSATTSAAAVSQIPITTAAPELSATLATVTGNDGYVYVTDIVTDVEVVTQIVEVPYPYARRRSHLARHAAAAA